MALAPEASPLLSRTLEFDTPTSVVQPTSSDIQALLEAGYTEAEIPVQQPATESIRVTVIVEPPAASGQDASTDRSSLHLSSDSDDDGAVLLSSLSRPVMLQHLQSLPPSSFSFWCLLPKGERLEL